MDTGDAVLRARLGDGEMDGLEESDEDRDVLPLAERMIVGLTVDDGAPEFEAVREAPLLALGEAESVGAIVVEADVHVVRVAIEEVEGHRDMEATADTRGLFEAEVEAAALVEGKEVMDERGVVEELHDGTVD